MDYLLGLLIGGGMIITWFIMGLLNNRAKKAEQESRDLYESIKNAQLTKAKLRNDAAYTKRVRDTFND